MGNRSGGAIYRKFEEPKCPVWSSREERFLTETTEEKELKERHYKLKRSAIIILVLIGIVLVCVGSFLFANGSLFQGENKQMDSANVDEPTWEEQDLSKKEK